MSLKLRPASRDKKFVSHLTSNRITSSLINRPLLYLRRMVIHDHPGKHSPRKRTNVCKALSRGTTVPPRGTHLPCAGTAGYRPELTRIGHLHARTRSLEHTEPHQ